MTDREGPLDVIDFPHNTCGASRTLLMWSQNLESFSDAIESDPEWVVGTIHSVLTSLWKLRTKEAARDD